MRRVAGQAGAVKSRAGERSTVGDRGAMVDEREDPRLSWCWGERNAVATSEVERFRRGKGTDCTGDARFRRSQQGGLFCARGARSYDDPGLLLQGTLKYISGFSIVKM